MKYLFISAVLLTQCLGRTWAQNDANLIIDGDNRVFKGSSSFPYWLKASQTINVGPGTASISILEFKIDTVNGNLSFSKPIIVETSSRVPLFHTWKIEAVAFLDNSMVGTKPAVFSSPAIYGPGTHTWTVPPGVTRVCVEVWGSGGNGADGDWQSGDGGGGGGGGAYGYSCFTLQPGSQHEVKVGNTSSGSSFDSTLLFANGGSNAVGKVGGNGGTSNGSIIKIAGSSGNSAGGTCGENGGNGGNGGTGGKGGCFNWQGIYFPGAHGTGLGFGGGGGGTVVGSRTNYSGQGGGPGKVVIHW